MSRKRNKRPARRTARTGGRTFRAAVLAFATTFAGGLASFVGWDIVPLAITAGLDRPAAPVGARPSPARPPATVTAHFGACRHHFPHGEPPAVAAPEPVALCFDAFAVLYSGTAKTPVYVVERLTSKSVRAAKGIPRSDRFYEEARLPSRFRATLQDYRGSGYDRGHMAPAGDMPTAAAKAQSFSLANMVPQHPALNQVSWNRIEQSTRKYAGRAEQDVYVYTGPHFGKTPATIGQGRVWVPTATWKVVYVPDSGRRWAYWAANDGGPHSLKPIEYGAFLARGGPDVLQSVAAD